MKKSNAAHIVPWEIDEFTPVTENQELAVKGWENGHNLALVGSAGTGKTYMALNLALKELFDNLDVYRSIMIVRSVVPTRDAGHLPGAKEEKEEPYQLPYQNLCDEIFGYRGAYNKLISANKVRFETTSYIRGATFDQTIIIVDEMQNMNFHELDSIITRIGNDCKIIFCGDHKQSDFKYDDEKEGIMKFLSIIETMRSFRLVEFGWIDIVRSDFVRDYIMTKEMLDL